METLRTFTANSEDELWQQVAADMAQEKDFLQYSAQLNQGRYRMLLDIDIDMGGGFEGSFESTTLTAAITGPMPLHFHLHEQDWVNELGKLLGLEDVALGYPVLDDAFIIKTNNPTQLKLLLSSAELQGLLLKYRDDMQLTLGPADHQDGTAVELRFMAERALVDPAQLQEVYHMLLLLLEQLNPPAVVRSELSEGEPHTRSRS
jgi:hypothetical protein